MNINRNHIVASCRIKDNRVILDGSVSFKQKASSFNDFSKETLRHFNVSYPKFFKMDHLSRLAFLGSELILSVYPDPDTALLFSNRSSSLDTDKNYQSSIANRWDYYPSPAVFVYTLPNICLGEISIRHQLKTENSFFIFDRFNPAFMADYTNILLDSGKANQVLCGWVELYGESYDGLVYLVGKDGQREHTKEQLEILYNS